MKRKITVSNIVAGVLVIIGCISFYDDVINICAANGCKRHKESGSKYCVLHSEEYRNWQTYSSETNYSNRKHSTSTVSGSLGIKSSNTSKNTSGSNYYQPNVSSPKSYYNSYDDGYEDAYENEDYDEDRYKNDKDYAEGVDDAMDERDW